VDISSSKVEIEKMQSKGKKEQTLIVRQERRAHSGPKGKMPRGDGLGKGVKNTIERGGVLLRELGVAGVKSFGDAKKAKQKRGFMSNAEARRGRLR